MSGDRPRFPESFNVLGTEYPLVRKKLPGDDEGEFELPSAEVHLDREVVPVRAWDVANHELFHIAEFATDTPRRLRVELGLTEAQIEKIREVYAGTVLPVYADALERAGILQRPLPPVAQKRRAPARRTIRRRR